MFSDHAKIIIRSGKGGDGHVSFRREKYVPDGGPDGGDGGKGGDVIFVIDKSNNTLREYRFRRKFSAEDGEEGKKKNQHGKNGEDLILKVPEGTVIYDENKRVIVDMSGENKSFTVLTGGKGGLGNQHFATATMQAPKYAKPGGEAKEIEVYLELKVIADVGLIGFPNVGKSTFLSHVTNATPKIGNYHFTTLSPILGVVNFPNIPEFVIADIPGIIEGASSGVGLGLSFLKHIERTKVLVHLVDGASVEGRNPISDIKAINNELKKYNIDLTKRPQIIALNKMDALSEDEKNNVVNKVKDAFKEERYPIFPISAVTGEGVKELLFKVYEEREKFPKDITIYKSESDVNKINDMDETINVTKDQDGIFHIEGERVKKMLGYTNLESERGFLFFQKFIKKTGIEKDLRSLGIKDGDTVDVYGYLFEYYR